jgi:DNA-binding XRE family transcriptional regulator
MDTDDLSQEAYKAVIIEAELFDHNLTIRFGLLSYDCEDEEQFLNESIKLATALKKVSNNTLDDIFFGEPPNKEKLNKVLDKIISNINAVNKIPIDKKHYDF